MKYLKLFEELNRITVLPEEKVKLKEITRFFLSILKDKRFSGGVKEKRRLEYDLGILKSLIKNDDYVMMQHRNDGYKKVDSIAQQLSKLRDTQIVFDRKDNCFKVSNGKAMVTFNFPWKSKDIFQGQEIKAGGAFIGSWTNAVYINYRTGDYFNDSTKFPQKIKDPSYIKIWDFTGGNIIIPFEANRSVIEDGLYADMFSVIYHEFIHAKDPIVWQGVEGYAAPGSKNKGSYGSHPSEIQTMFNNLLEIVSYYFERTWRGDTDGGGLNYNLTKEELMKNFFPTLFEVIDFIKNKRKDLSLNAMKQLSGTNKSIKFIKAICAYMNDAKENAPDKMKFVYQWMEDDFVKLSETFNKKISEINKKKPKGQELPLIMKIEK